MTHCLNCGKLLEGKRKHAKYCDAKCRAAYYRKLRRRDEKLSPEVTALVETMRKSLPITAEQLDAFIIRHGPDCAEAAIKLCLYALAEAQEKGIKPKKTRARAQSSKLKLKTA